jgi:hypothetical protein
VQRGGGWELQPAGLVAGPLPGAAASVAGPPPHWPCTPQSLRLALSHPLQHIPRAPRACLLPPAQGLQTTDGAVMLVEPTHLDQLLHPQFDDEEAYKGDVLGSGLPASPGAAVGQVCGSSSSGPGAGGASRHGGLHSCAGRIPASIAPPTPSPSA